jgi:hypothetical protein
MVPKAHVRVRRDWEQLPDLRKIVAVCRSFSVGPQGSRELDAIDGRKPADWVNNLYFPDQLKTSESVQKNQRLVNAEE